MRYTPAHSVIDEQVVRTLIAENPWATLISSTPEGMVASNYPVLVDDESERLALVTHVGRPDDRYHGFGDGGEILVIFAGPHGYISPSWYSPGATRAPTWNFTTAHCYGVPQILEPAENAKVLTKLVAHFEQHVDHPMWLEQETIDKLADGTCGIRIPVGRFVCKVKMSADKDRETQARVLEHLRTPGPYASEALADDMERALASWTLPTKD
jgi:transcriptional regulator